MVYNHCLFHCIGGRDRVAPSPLLFALALEPLAEAFRQHKDVYGITIEGTVHKIALYADDILLFLTKPEISIPTILSIIWEFSSFYGSLISLP